MSLAMGIGVRVVIRDAVTLDDVGVCTAPTPVEPGDLVALEHGPPWRVVAALPVAGSVVPVLARPAALGDRRSLTRRSPGDLLELGGERAERRALRDASLSRGPALVLSRAHSRIIVAVMSAPQGRLELTWTNKHRTLLRYDDGSYQWVAPSDYRVAEVRLPGR